MRRPKMTKNTRSHRKYLTLDDRGAYALHVLPTYRLMTLLRLSMGIAAEGFYAFPSQDMSEDRQSVPETGHSVRECVRHRHRDIPTGRATSCHAHAVGPSLFLPILARL
jgi:hypothetical protein